jgi:hypothetical protein
MIAGAVGAAITATVKAIVDKRKTSAEVEKTAASTEAIKAEVQVTLSGAAMELVSGLRDELNRMRSAHAEEIREIRAAHTLEMSTLRENHRLEVEALRKRAETAESDVGILRAQVTKLQARIDEAGLPDVPVVVSLPEVEL